jgi:hypothetical protein
MEVGEDVPGVAGEETGIADCADAVNDVEGSDDHQQDRRKRCASSTSHVFSPLVSPPRERPVAFADASIQTRILVLG